MTTDVKVAIITGASAGIGRAAAISLYKTGWTVVLIARREDALKETIGLLPTSAPTPASASASASAPGAVAGAGAASGGGGETRSTGQQAQAQQQQRHECERAEYVIADLSKEEDIVRAFAHVKEKYGRLDLLFNNAGLNVPAIPMEELSSAQYRSLMAVNVDACFYCAQEAVKIMKAQKPKGGRIINNGSISAYTPRVFSAPYTMSKHAILGLTKSLSLDGRADDIVCSQLDIGGAGTDIQGTTGKLQPNGQRVKEALFDVQLAGDAVAYMANLPLSVNILSQTIMANTMPFVGRG